MRRLAFILMLLLATALPASAQLSAYHDRALSPQASPSISPSTVIMVPIAYGQVRVCTSPASGSPCTPLASIFDLQGNALTVSGGNFGQVITDVTGQFSFQCNAGTYQIQVAASASNTPQLTYLASCPNNGSNAPLNTNNIFTGNNTFTNINGAINPLTFAGADIGAQINAANAAFPGQPIVIPPSSSCYQFSTPIIISAGSVPTSIKGGGASSTCLQYTASTGTAFSFNSALVNGIAGTISDFELMTTVSGSTATGLAVGTGNSCSNCKVERMYIHGFQVGSTVTTYHVEYNNDEFSTCSTAAGSIGIQTTGAFADDTHISGGRIIGCNTLLKIGNVFVVWVEDVLLQSPLGGVSATVWVDNSSGGLLNCVQCHWYNSPAGGATNWFNSSGPTAIVNSLFEDAKTTGSVTSFATQTAGTFISMVNNAMLSGGETSTEFVLISNPVSYAYFFGNSNYSTPQIPTIWNTNYGGSLVTVANHPNLNTFTEPFTTAGTQATLTGTGACATFSNQVGGSWGGAFKCTGVTGASTLTITFPAGIPAALDGLKCDVKDETTVANVFNQGSHTTNSCTLSAASITQNDFFVWTAFAF